jgi:hypothetical protein
MHTACFKNGDLMQTRSKIAIAWTVILGALVVLNLSLYARRVANQRRRAAIEKTSHMAALLQSQASGELRRSARAGDMPAFQTALEQIPLKLRRDKVTTALADAVISGKFAPIRYMYESKSGKEVALTTQDSDSLLDYAASYTRPEMVRYLVDHGADVNEGEGTGWTPLDWCAQHSEPDALIIARFLLEHGAHVDARIAEQIPGKPHYYFTYTPLMLAAREYHFDMMRLLLKHHANPRLKDSNGDTASALLARLILKSTIDTLFYQDPPPYPGAGFIIY